MITLYVDPEHPHERLEHVSDGILIGHALSHEIGHVLLGPHSHSATGIMRPEWRVAEQRLMLMNSLVFSAGQAARMRENLSAMLARNHLG